MRSQDYHLGSYKSIVLFVGLKVWQSHETFWLYPGFLTALVCPLCLCVFVQGVNTRLEIIHTSQSRVSNIFCILLSHSMLFSAFSGALMWSASIQFANADSRLDRATDAAKVLKTYYSEDAGLWRTGSWWQSANSMQALADLQDYSKAGLTNNVWSNTFAKAPARGGIYFLNSYFDDEGWWGTPLSFPTFRACVLTMYSACLDTRI